MGTLWGDKMKKTWKLLIAILAIIVNIPLVLIIAFNIPPIKYIEVNDASFYTSAAYLDENYYECSYYRSLSYCCGKFFPKLDDISFDYQDLMYYMKVLDDDRIRTYATYPDATAVLEFSFYEEEDYTYAKNYFFSMYEFLDEPVRDDTFTQRYVMPVATFSINEWNCNVVKDRPIVYPCSLIICTNDNTNKIRLLYYYEHDRDFISRKVFVNSIVDGSNCDWSN